jgi:UDP-N-acetyl-2-amino-2-deoxyglucuronate dehydrogenase
MNPILFAVVGCGHIGKRHAEMISRNDFAKLIGVVDTDENKIIDFRTEGTPVFNNVQEFISKEILCDVVCIATPNGTHIEIALQLIEAGYHVVVEKPLGLDIQSSERLLFKALEKQRMVFAVMQNRYSPPSKWLKEIVNSGVLGEIFLVQTNCFWNRDERYYKKESWHGDLHLDGGTLFTQFSHFIDILFWVFGDVSNVQSKLADFNHGNLTEFEDSGVAMFDFVTGGVGTLSFSTSVWDSNLESSITVIAENGSIKIGGQYMNEVVLCHVKGYEMPVLPPTNPSNDYGPYKGSAANHNYVIENVVNVLNSNASITTNAFEGLKVVEIINKIYSAADRSKYIKTLSK